MPHGGALRAGSDIPSRRPVRCCNVLGPRLLAHFRNRPVPPPRAGSPNRVQSIQPNATRAGRGGISSRVSWGGEIQSPPRSP
jgi:hypothetical protein